MTVDDTLNTREHTHGDYADTALVSQQLKAFFKNYMTVDIELNHVMTESLDMIATKLARILVGDCGHADSWHDVAGYAQLVERTLLRKEIDTQPAPAPLTEGVFIVRPDISGAGFVAVGADGVEHPGRSYDEAFQRALGGSTYGPDDEPDPPSHKEVRELYP